MLKPKVVVAAAVLAAVVGAGLYPVRPRAGTAVRCAPADVQGGPPRFRQEPAPQWHRRSRASHDDLDTAPGRPEQQLLDHHDAGARGAAGASRRSARRVRPPGADAQRARQAGRVERSRAAGPKAACSGGRRRRRRRQHLEAGRQRAAAGAARDAQERHAAEDPGREESPGARRGAGQAQTAAADLRPEARRSAGRYPRPRDSSRSIARPPCRKPLPTPNAC